jgi:site-specific DNA recombinase
VRLNEQQIDQQLKAFFTTIRIEDATERQWFVDVIKAKAHAGHDQNRQHQKELKRRREQVNAKLQTLLDLRMDGEVTADDYATKRQELHDRQNAIALQLQTSDRDGREIAELAIKAFELSQSLREKWVKANYQAKRTILGIMLKSVRLNSENLEFTPRKPFDFLRDAKLVPLSGAMGI